MKTRSINYRKTANSVLNRNFSDQKINYEKDYFEIFFSHFSKYFSSSLSKFFREAKTCPLNEECPLNAVPLDAVGTVWQAMFEHM